MDATVSTPPHHCGIEESVPVTGRRPDDHPVRGHGRWRVPALANITGPRGPTRPRLPRGRGSRTALARSGQSGCAGAGVGPWARGATPAVVARIEQEPRSRKTSIFKIGVGFPGQVWI